MNTSDSMIWLSGLSAALLGVSVLKHRPWNSKIPRDDGSGAFESDNPARNTDGGMLDGCGSPNSCKRSLYSQGATLHAVHKEYLVLHFFIRLADWLQGTNMFTLYTSYGVDPGVLFVTGFASSAVLGPFVGRWVDVNGRKKGCLIYCILEVIIQIFEHSQNIHVLLIGRVLGGISTALLFSAFESWITSKHRSLNLPTGDVALESMFSIASTLNGLGAVLAGLIARVAFNWGGEIAPFQVSMVITMGCLVWIACRWDENVGTQAQDIEQVSFFSSIGSVLRNRNIALLALIQAFFEGSMYIFVFVWVSVFLRIPSSGERPPIEILFSALMLALSLGGSLFDILSTNKFAMENKMHIGSGIFLIASISMASVNILVQDTSAHQTFFGGHVSTADLTMLNFCIFEACVGMFDPWSALVRYTYVPENVSASIMTLSRVPLNVFVGVGVNLTKKYDLSVVFSICSAMNLVSSIASSMLTTPKKELDKKSA